MTKKCAVKRCRQMPEYVFYDREVCEKCWTGHCEGTFDLKEHFGIKE